MDLLANHPYHSSAILPDMSDRRLEMLQAFDSGGILELASLLWRYSKYDLRNPSTRYSAEIMLEDKKNEMVIIDQLASIHPAVLRACIRNTIGYELSHNPHIKEMSYPTDNSSAIYINTISRLDRPGCFLNQLELVVLERMISNYLEGKPNDEEAIAIDSVYTPSRKKIENTVKGARYWKSGGTATWDLLAQMKRRIRPELDPNGTIYQIQSPFEVGYSKNVQSRIIDHHPESNLRSSTKPWALVLSCLTVMNIQFKVNSQAILYIWDSSPKVRQQAEILITALCSSRVIYGGYNPIQAGTSVHHGKISYLSEQMTVFLQKSWIKDGITAISDVLKGKQKTIQEAEHLQQIDITEQCNKHETELGLLEQESKSNDTELKQLIHDYQACRTRVNNRKVELLKEQESLKKQKEFHQSLALWLLSDP